MDNNKDDFFSQIEYQGPEQGQEEVIGDTPCPCCGFITIPEKGDALGYICPVCFWEIDLFIESDHEPSDQNNGLTLKQAKENYKNLGAVSAMMKEYCRQAREEEYPDK